jgi:hypothetical protein
MQRYRSLLLCFILCCSWLLPTAPVDFAQAQAPVKGNNSGEPIKTTLFPNNDISLASLSEYLSPVTRSEQAFDFVLLRRVAEVPVGAQMNLFLRTSLDNVTWSDWLLVPMSDDLWMEIDGPNVWWSEVIGAGTGARYWQVRAEMYPSPSGEFPALESIDVNSVDTTSFAPAQDGLAERETISPSATVAKPAVVSRTAWGSPDGQGSRAAVAYYPVNHLVVHHTAESNTMPSGGWAARVRAIWSFHAITRGWGDIGYNYLIDPNGVIYEGRAGGDNAVGFHDTANYGSMGVSVIGTYASVSPSIAAQDSLVKILAWKAAQKGIDPLGKSYYYGCAISQYCKPFNTGGVVANIAGHRQVTPGHTTCPGDAFMALMPNIRQRVVNLIATGSDGGSGNTGDNGDLTVDNLELASNATSSAGFFKSSANWYDRACGYGGHTYYTFGTNNPAESTNWATWRANIPNTGNYRLYAYIPQWCGIGTGLYATKNASYEITHANGTSTIAGIDHNTADEWVDLGVYQFNSGTSGSVKLSDLTGEAFASNKNVVFFDTIRWVPEEGSTNIQILDVKANKTELTSGELLKLEFKVKNTGSTTISTQAPQASRTTNADTFNDGQAGRIDDSYVYDQGECFLGNAAGDYASFHKEGNKVRLAVKVSDTSQIADCSSAYGGYPWRWGLNGDLAPNEERTVIGYVRFREPGSYTLSSNVVQEYVKYFYPEATGTKPITIKVSDESFAPISARYNEQLQPVAQVYALNDVPDNFLARTANPLSIRRGAKLGEFVWYGEFKNWGNGGPIANATDNFLIEQVRTFYAPVAGAYTFYVNSDDGAWLWVDGEQVINNSGLHSALDPNEENGTTYDVVGKTGTIDLNVGYHTVAFKYFERSGSAAAGYGVQLPNSTQFSQLPEDLDPQASRLGNTFTSTPDIAFSADDTGGKGIAYIQFSWDNQQWQDNRPCIGKDCLLLKLGKLQNGTYTIYYRAVDKAGNIGEAQTVSFTVQTGLSSSIKRIYLPLVRR